MTAKFFIWDLSSKEKFGSRKKKRDLVPHYCETCGHTITPPTKHRIKPGKNGGKYVPGNVIAQCLNCHGESDRGLIPDSVLFQVVFDRLKRDSSTKRCWVCERWKSCKDFAEDPSAEDGKHSECRDCMNEFEIAGFLDETTKVCSVCLKPKALELFDPYLFTKDHHRPECNECRHAIVAHTQEIVMRLAA